MHSPKISQQTNSLSKQNPSRSTARKRQSGVRAAGGVADAFPLQLWRTGERTRASPARKARLRSFSLSHYSASSHPGSANGSCAVQSVSQPPRISGRRSLLTLTGSRGESLGACRGTRARDRRRDLRCPAFWACCDEARLTCIPINDLMGRLALIATFCHCLLLQASL